MFFQILGASAEFEHALMSERARDGLEAARARGRTGGQKPKLGERQARLAREMYEAGELTVAQIAAEFGVTRPTIYHHLDQRDGDGTSRRGGTRDPVVPAQSTLESGSFSSSVTIDP